MNNNLISRLASKQGLVAILVFSLPFLSLVTLWSVSAVSFLLFILALFIVGPARAALVRHWPLVRWVVLAFLIKFLLEVVYYLARSDAHLGSLEKPLRMFLAVSAMLLVLVLKPDRKVLWWGVIAGAVGGLLFIGYQRVVLDMDRPGGLINAITFGDLALCLGLLSLAATADLRESAKAVWTALGAFAGIAASILTGTRGGWVAFALAAVLFIRYSAVLGGRRVQAVIALSFVLAAGSWFVPESGVRERVNQGVADVTNYLERGTVFSNVGIRLELWKAASLLIADSPLAGVSRQSAKQQVAQHVAAGRLDKAVLEADHFHNDALQVLVTGGAIGLLAWLATLAAPFWFFARVFGHASRASTRHMALALAGMLMVVCYFGFGLTEVIFWSVKASLFYALMIFLLMGFCLNAKENDGE